MSNELSSVENNREGARAVSLSPVSFPMGCTGERGWPQGDQERFFRLSFKIMHHVSFVHYTLALLC